MDARVSSPIVISPSIRHKSALQWLSSSWCSLWGHQVDNHRFRLESPAAGRRECPCGARYLAEDGSFTHVRHTLTCFFGHHTYTKVVDLRSASPMRRSGRELHGVGSRRTPF